MDKLLVIIVAVLVYISDVGAGRNHGVGSIHDAREQGNHLFVIRLANFETTDFGEAFESDISIRRLLKEL